MVTRSRMGTWWRSCPRWRAVDGVVRLSDEEEDRKKDVEQASVHPPDRIVIVRGDSENVQMMRQAFPTTLMIIFGGAFLGFLFLEFKSRKADPKRLPQTFEVVAGICLVLLVIIWFIHILP